MSQEVQNLFNEIAPTYDKLNSVLSFNTDRRWRQKSVQELASCRKVLDLCAGTLAMTTELLRLNPRCIVRAVDFSKPMLERGMATLPIEFRDRVEIGVADAMKMQINPQSYDGVMCAYGMRNIDDNALVLQKLRQGLKPGGKLVVLEFFKPAGVLSKLFNLTYAQIVIPILGKIVSGHPEAYRYLRDSVRGYYTAAAFCELLKEAGFTNIRAKALTGGVSHLVTAEIPA